VTYAASTDKPVLAFLTKQTTYVDQSISYQLTGVPTSVVVEIFNKSKGGKQYLDAVSLTLNDATRLTDTRSGDTLLPPPSAPEAFRGSN
jgi:hypothetical protein